MKRNNYPFSALVGQEKMKTGLLLNAIDPTIGGILISGHKGTGKSTAVRSLTQVLPMIEVVDGCPYNCSPSDERAMCPACQQRVKNGEALPGVARAMPLVELPLSATEDRVIGTLHVEEILKSGERRFEPGLLASANRGILYVDEVNLLDDHLVDILLDAAASGINVIEREGISFTHPARFMLVGTMNPEEGELRPQFLDRFGLSLSVGSVTDHQLRRIIVENRISFDADQDSFCARYEADETILANQIETARMQAAKVVVPGEMVDLAVSLSNEVRAQGHRAEIAIIKTARALAAFLEKSRIDRDHIIEAARYVLPHRITTIALATPEMADEKIDEILKKVMEEDTGSDELAESTGDIDEWDDLSSTVPGATAASNVGMLFTFLEEKKKSFLKQTS